MTTKHKDDTPQGRAVADQVGEAKQDAGVQKDVAKDLAKDALAQEARASTGTEGEMAGNKWLGSDESQLYAHLLDGGIENLKKVVNPKDGIGEEKVAGLLILERNGKNRTEFVKLLKDRLGIDDIRKELPQAGGPDYTHDTTNLSDL